MPKFLLNLLVQISKVAKNLKFQIKIRKGFITEIGSAPVSAQPRPTSSFLPDQPLPPPPVGLSLSVGPAGRCVSGAPPGCRLPHREAPPVVPPSPLSAPS
jgi:hypothetical protein